MITLLAVTAHKAALAVPGEVPSDVMLHWVQAGLWAGLGLLGTLVAWSIRTNFKLFVATLTDRLDIHEKRHDKAGEEIAQMAKAVTDLTQTVGTHQAKIPEIDRLRERMHAVEADLIYSGKRTRRKP